VTTVSSAEHTRRDFLYIATAAAGAVGAASVLVPLVAQMNPDASTIAAGAPIDVDLAPIADGQIVKVFWRSKPVFIFHRTAKERSTSPACPIRNPTPRAPRKATSPGWS
jgi:ubiquinol-cytochrome c reductase iron-sulfur subunit